MVGRRKGPRGTPGDDIGAFWRHVAASWRHFGAHWVLKGYQNSPVSTKLNEENEVWKHVLERHEFDVKMNAKIRGPNGRKPSSRSILVLKYEVQVFRRKASKMRVKMTSKSLENPQSGIPRAELVRCTPMRAATYFLTPSKGSQMQPQDAGNAMGGPGTGAGGRVSREARRQSCSNISAPGPKEPEAC